MKTDEELKRDVERQLEWEPSIDASAIGVAVKDGAVVLTGEVSSTEVENHLAIEPD
jgi:osmotically-inducible protein OsmY